ncbi:MAG TPA: hypothetical protein DCY13_13310, partial [Verrucomicrobiales bacterium]|nr:hypothetical protein [Verrucomicrobiales bacterium]
LNLNYRIDPGAGLAQLPMFDNGTGGDAIANDGVYSATIPGQAAGQRAAFHVSARDVPGTTTYFPAEAPVREALVQWGEQEPFGNFTSYRFWLTSANISTWETREKLSNHRLDMTFVAGQHRVIYNGGIRYRGSPWLRPGYSGPTNSLAALVFKVQPEDPYIGVEEFNLDWLEQPGRDPTLQREKLSYWIGAELEAPFSHQRYVVPYINGVRRGQVYTDSQEPSSGDYVSAWFDGRDEGDIYKIDDWFEFNDEPRREFNENAQMLKYTTTGGAKKQARYRWSWEKKSNGGYNDDYTGIFNLADALNEPDPVLYEQAVSALVDVEQWLRVFAARHIVADWDGWGYNRGKNMSTYQVPDGRFHLLPWDLDFSLGGGSSGPTDSIYSVNDPAISRMYNHPAFNRLYLQIYKEAVNGPLSAARIEPIMDENYRAFQESAVVAASPSPIKSWVAQRRSYLAGVTSAAEAPFEITTNGGVDFSTSNGLLVLEGTAPLDVRTIQLNGVSYPVWWASVNTWQIRIPLPQGVSGITVAGYDRDGVPVPGSADSINVNFIGTPEPIQGSLVIHELMYNAPRSGANYLELLNVATNTAFDLTGFRLNGLGFTFPGGTVINPGEHLVVAENLSVFAPTYGYAIRVAGEFPGSFDRGGETISLIKPGATPAQDLVIDSVRYDDDLPWPLVADGLGSALQLRDASRDNNRLGNWAAGPFVAETNDYPLVSMTHVWRYNQNGVSLGNSWRTLGYNDSAWPQGPALLFVEDAPLPAPKNTPLTLGPTTFYFRTQFTNDLVGSNLSLMLSLVIDDGAVIYLNGQELYSIGVPPFPVYSDLATRTVGDAVIEGPFLLPGDLLVPGVNELAVEVHQSTAGSTDVVFGLELLAREVMFGPYTPGAANYTKMSLPAFPAVWINEIQPNNASGATDNFGDREPWLELYNAGGTTVDLAGFHLSDSYTNLTRWSFPAGASIAPGQFLVVWL